MNVRDLQKMKSNKIENIVFFSFDKNGRLQTKEFKKELFIKLKDKYFLSREILELNEEDDNYLEVWII